MSFETPLWTITGVIVGFGLSWLYGILLNKRRRRAALNVTTERIKKSMHLMDSKQTIRKLADLLPQFDESEQIEILEEASLESSLNSFADEVTCFIIGELRWICVGYEVDFRSTLKRHGGSKKDHKKLKSVRDILWNISMQVVEYTQSREVLESALNFLNILNEYAILHQHEKAIYSSIDLYKYIGLSSIGDQYPSGYSIRNFRFGIEKSINQLLSLKEDLQKSSFNETAISSSMLRINTALNNIKSEQKRRLSDLKTGK